MTETFESLYQLVFLSLALTLALLERVGALRRQPVQLARRWPSNIGLFLIGSVATTILLPAGLYAFAQHRPPGLLSRLELPFAGELLLTFVFLDLWRYWEHRVFHRVPLLWRLHLVHHSDTQIDVTTSERHHPLEILLGTAVLMTLVAMLGLPAPAVGLYLLVATAVALYSHANLRLPALLDRPLSLLVVTPPVHAMHHSDLQKQTDSNFGSVLTVWDRLFGTYVDPANARIPHFGLAYFHRPEDTGLARVLQQPFLFRRNLDYPARDGAFVASRSSTTTAARFGISPAWRDAALGGAAGCVLVALVMWPTALDLVASWRSEPYQYAWLVLPMIVFLLGWNQPSTALPATPRPDFTGVFVVIVAAACWAAGTLMNIDIGRQFALILALQGVAMSTLGWRSYWRLFPTLALLFLTIPCGDLLQPALRMLTLKSIELFVTAAHLPHSIDGFLVFVGAHRYIVLDDCSGLSYVTLATFLGYCFGLLLYRSFFRIVALSLLGALLGILANAVRVNAIVLIDWLRGSQMDLAAHGAIQWIALFATLGALFYVLSRLEIDATPSPVTDGKEARPRGKFAPVIAGLSGLLIAGSAVGLPVNALRAPHAAKAGMFPQRIAGYVLADPAAVWTVDRYGQTESTSLVYRRDDRELQVVVVETLAPNVKLPESVLAPDDRTVWRDKPIDREAACTAARCFALRHASWQHDKSLQLRHAYFAYSIGDFVTDSRFALRAAHGWRRLIGSRDNPRLIGIISDDGVMPAEELAATFQAVQKAVTASSGPAG